MTVPDLPPRAGAPPDSTAAPRRIAVAELFGTRREVVLVHAGVEYRLRITRQGKLILTK